MTEITVFAKSPTDGNGTLLAKRLELVEGKLVSDGSACRMALGLAEVVRMLRQGNREKAVRRVRALIDWLLSLAPNPTLFLAVFNNLRKAGARHAAEIAPGHDHEVRVEILFGIHRRPELSRDRIGQACAELAALENERL